MVCVNRTYSNGIGHWKKKIFYPKFYKYCGYFWPGRIKVSIGTVVVAILAILMMIELYSNINEFTSNNVIPRIDAIPALGLEGRPNITVCIPYFSEVLSDVDDWISKGKNSSVPCEICDEMRANKWDVWNQALLNTPKFEFTPLSDEASATKAHPVSFHNLSVNIIHKLFSELDTMAINATNARWTQPIVDALWLFFSCKFAKDNEAFVQRMGSSILINCPQVEHVPDETLDRLYDLLLDGLELHLELKVHDAPVFSDGKKIPLKDIERFIPIGDKMCFPMPGRDPVMMVKYKPIIHTFVDDESVEQPPWLNHHRTKNISSWMEIYEDVMLYDIYSNAPQTLLQTENVPMISSGWTHVLLTYNKETHIDARLMEKNCSNDTVPMSCLAKAQFNWASNYCKCVPFSLRYLRGNHSTLPYCNRSLYEPCREKNETPPVDNSYCNRRCEYVSYKYWPSVRREITDQRVGGYCVHFISAGGHYIKFDYTPKITLSALMAQIGGTLNLYLGISGLSICTFIICCIDLVKRVRQQRKTSTASMTHAFIQGLRSQLLWFINLFQLFQMGPNTGTNRNDEDGNAYTNARIFEELITLCDSVNELKERVKALEERKGENNHEHTSTLLIRCGQSKCYLQNGHNPRDDVETTTDCELNRAHGESTQAQKRKLGGQGGQDTSM